MGLHTRCKVRALVLYRGSWTCFATAALGADVKPLVALSGGTARGQFLRLRLHSSAPNRTLLCPLRQCQLCERPAGSCRMHICWKSAGSEAVVGCRGRQCAGSAGLSICGSCCLMFAHLHETSLVRLADLALLAIQCEHWCCVAGVEHGLAIAS